MTDILARVVAITGASEGIGAATATHLAAQGATVVLGARRPGPLQAVADAIAAGGGRVLTRPTDVTRREDLQALVDLATSECGRLDVLVANAGAMPISPLAEGRVDDWDTMIDVNLRGVLHGIAAALPVFRAQGAGHFVTVGSTAGRKVVPTMAVYAATKSGVRALMDGLRQELAPEGLRATLVDPGMTATTGSLSVPDAATRAAVERLAMPADAIARAIAYAIDQPDGVNVGEVVVRPTAQA